MENYTFFMKQNFIKYFAYIESIQILSKDLKINFKCLQYHLTDRVDATSTLQGNCIPRNTSRIGQFLVFRQYLHPTPKKSKVFLGSYLHYPFSSSEFSMAIFFQLNVHLFHSQFI